jgi:5-methylcytosine-specific restriction endonuclease McrA
MTSSNNDNKSPSHQLDSVQRPHVDRSIVESGLPYSGYRQILREDFFYSCGYCTLTEFEAQGLSFQIDHYEPQTSRPDLANDYQNLMYSCDECNRLKLDVDPPPAAKEAGQRFYRPDGDVWDHHFSSSGQRVDSRSNVGEFSIEGLDLNRQSLRRLRDIRRRLVDCDDHIAKGILGLRRFRIDQLPATVRARAVAAINNLTSGAETMSDRVDRVLKDGARSPLLDPDDEKADRKASRDENLSRLKGLYPGRWRGREHKASL